MSAERVAQGLLDTSIFIALESGRQLRKAGLPTQSAISIVTRAELRAGVLAADGLEARDLRLATFEASRRFAVLPIDGAVDHAWAQMRAYLAASERRIRANDLWIAATAAAYEIPLVTQDTDFDAVNGVAGLTVIPL
jgi:predicted nucleic acid-binding protein